MNIEIGRYAGFCRGVKHAVDKAFACAREVEGPIFTDGELIHNPQTLELLEQHGVHVLATDDGLEPVRDRVVIVRAHGVPPQRLAALRAASREVRNLTCRDVAKVQGLVRIASRRGRAVIIFGKSEHPEVRGILGHAERGFTVLSPDDVDALPELDRVLVVAQTTMNTRAYAAVCDRVRARFADVEVADTICPATEQRQNEVRELAGRNDCVLVIGGGNSSNTRRLYEIASEATSAHLISDASEVAALPLAGVRRLAVTAGASTPDWLIHEVVEEVRRVEQSRWTRLLRAALLLPLHSKLFVAAGAFLLSFAVADNIGVPFSPAVAVLASLYLLSMSLMNAYTARATLRLENARRFHFLVSRRHLLAALFAVSTAGVLAIAISLGNGILWLTLASLVLGVAYNLSYLPIAGDGGQLGFVSKRTLLALKSVVISVAVTLLLNGLPLLESNPQLWPTLSGASRVLSGLGVYFSLYFVFMVMFTQQALFELKTAQTDRIAGVSSLLHLLRPGQLTLLLYALPTVLLVIMAAGLATGIYPLEKARYFAAVAYTYLVLRLARNRRLLSNDVAFELVVDSNLYVAGLIALL